MKACHSKGCVFHSLTILLNIVAIIALLVIFSKSYGHDAQVILVFLIPPVLSIIALRKRSDKEERSLKKRIRKAQLRKELDDLKKFDTSE